MPIRRINYTARRRVARADVDITIRSKDGSMPYFDAAMRLSEYQFPADAKVFIEAYRQTTLMRFDFGTVSVPKIPSDRQLSEFQTIEDILFRLKVTAVSGRPGVLLGEAEQIRPREGDEEPQRRLPLLPPVPVELGQEVWKVDFVGGTRLLVNRELHDWRQTVASQVFRSLVYPAAMRQILERILIVDEYFALDDPDEWRSRWLRFASRLPGSGAPPQHGAREDELDDWIDNAVAGFARGFNLRTHYMAETAQA
jgi:hypothetical protein